MSGKAGDVCSATHLVCLTRDGAYLAGAKEHERAGVDTVEWPCRRCGWWHWNVSPGKPERGRLRLPFFGRR